jgi:PadR family transcriptional regulator
LRQIRRCANNVGIVVQPLGEFEVLMLLAVLRLRGDALPTSIRTEIEERAGRTVQRGAVYVTLDRLEAKGLLQSRLATLDSRRRVYRVSARGLRAVRRALQAVDGMRTGLESVLET